MSLYNYLRSQLFPPSDGQRSFIPQFRLEGRARNPNTEEGLSMRIADPLWMLGRQWQFGEFLGEDNASPVSVKINYRKRRLNRLGTDEANLQAIDVNHFPFEYCVENIPQTRLNLRQRVQAGQQMERLLESTAGIEPTEIISQLRLDYPLDENSLTSPLDETSQQFFDLMKGRVIDGQKLYQASLTNIVDEAWTSYVNWYQKQYNLKDEAQQNYWHAQQLRHQFISKYEAETGTPQEELLLRASDYQSGQLDWYSFDDILRVQLAEDGEKTVSEELQPISLSFSAMPDQRLYTFEDNKVDLGSMEIDPSDLLRLMLVNFSFISSNDWFTIPLEMALGEIAWIENIEVKDAFGIKTIIKNGLNEAGNQIGPILDASPLKVWDAFKVRSKQLSEFDPQCDALLVAPALARRQQSKPLEEVLLLRDEYANMVWGLEKTVQNAMGQARNGFDQHRLVHGSPLGQEPYLEPLQDERGNAIPAFRLSSTVPFNWIPYLPVHIAEKEIELRRARILHPDKNKLVNPLSQLILNDLSRLREEAVPRSGIKVRLSCQRVRWIDGSTHVWQGRSVTSGRGEGSSGLKFDELVNQETSNND